MTTPIKNTIKLQQKLTPGRLINKDDSLREDIDIDAGYYLHKEKLGEGGFSKVRLATHLLTGEKVAIKCMDKNKLGDDLFRIQTEINVLKTLNHKNISKLLQVIETTTKIYLVLEYCSGGELFDHIVAKQRLSEPESRVIMKSLIQCLAYLHSRGIAHRDLKPENILFDKNHTIKLIDFGLAAQSKAMNSILQLQTCCGSPAYAAPELIAGKVYSGPSVDVWSAGVILYALLVGHLPFDDENLNNLYKKIQSGKFVIPVWLSKEAKSLIASMIEIVPEKRITVKEILAHPWLNVNENNNEKVDVLKTDLNDCLLWELRKYFPNTPFPQLKWNVLNKFGYQTSTYWLLKEKLKSKANLTSTLSSSLDSVLDKINEVDETLIEQKPIPTKSEDKIISKIKDSPHTPKLIGVKRKLMLDEKSNDAVNTAPVLPPKRVPLPVLLSSYRKASPFKSVKDTYNILPVKKVDENKNVDSPVKVKIESSQIPMLIKSPLRTATNDTTIFSPPSSKYSDKKPKINEIINNKVKSSPFGLDARKTPVKQAISNATPKKSLLKRILESATPSTPSNPRNITASAPTTTKNITMTNFMDAQKCINKIMETLSMKGIECKQKGFTIHCSMNNRFHNVLTFNLEICKFNNYCAIRRKRLRGDAWHYKKICEDILRISNETVTES